MGTDLVLVTGASGYVAGHRILRLLDGGYNVRGTLRSLIFFLWISEMV
jgi:dihydroflavonol-4-reductase